MEIARPRLDVLLRRDVLGAPVTLVSAGAGSGKTTAVSLWLRGGGFEGASAWVTIDKRDNWPPALRRKIFTALATEPAAVSTPTVLVLDDVQELVEPEPLDELRELMERCPAALRLVLVSRSDPPLRLQRWRVDGRLAEIRAKHLAFRGPEARDLFGQYGIELTEAQLEVLLERTQGWAAGIRLAAMSLDPAAVDEGLARFAGDQHSVAEYLVGEVLTHFPERTQRFLLHLSVVDEVHGPLAEALTGDATAMTVLQDLADENELLFNFGASRSRVRFHPLLRQLLYHQLLAHHPEVAIVQHRQAALWLSNSGEPIGALRQAMLSRDEPLIGEMTLSALPVLFTPEMPALASVLADTDHGLPVIVRHVMHGDHAQALTEIDLRRKALPGLDSAEGIGLTMLELMAASSGPDTRVTVSRATEVLRRLRKAPTAIERQRCAALAYLGVALLWGGQTLRAEAYLLEAARQSKVHGQTVARTMCLSHVAILKAITGATRLATQYATAALALEASGAAHLGLAQTELLRGNLELAGQHLDEVAVDADEFCALAARVIEADLLRLRGAPAKALTLLDDVRSEMDRKGTVAGLLDRWQATVVADVDPERAADDPDARAQVRCARAECGHRRYSDAIKRLRPLLSEPEPLVAIEAWLTYAQALQGSHQDNAAVRAMSHALRLAERQRLLWPFAALDARGQAILQAHQHISATDFGRDVLNWLGGLAEWRDPEAPNANAASLPEPLTDRELIVLRYLPTLRRNTEIGDSLFVTVNTVKAHLKSIYRKLGVTSRREAVDKARELHLL